MKTRIGFAAMLATACAIAWMTGAWLSPPVLAAPGSAEVFAAVQEHEFVGARDGCRRCHLREYRSWESTPHASALETLEAEGEADNPECLSCHTTGYGQPTGFVSADETPELANVTCEVCHGPGADYRDRDVMQDRDASMAAGMMIPDEATCRSCHNEESPTFPGSFNFEEMLEEGVHDIAR